MDNYLFRIEQINSLYQTYAFLCQQKEPPKIYKDIKEFQFAKENLFILLISQLYSLFDKSGLDIRKIETTDQLLIEIKKDWEKIEKQTTKIRHNLGFHGSKDIKGIKNATSAFNHLGKDGIETIMGLFQKLKVLQINYLK